MKKLLSVPLLTLTLVGQAFASLPCAEEMAKAEAVEKAFTAWAAANKTDSDWDEITMDINNLEQRPATSLIARANITPAEATKLFNENKLSFFSDAAGPHQLAFAGKKVDEVGPIMENVYPEFAKKSCAATLEERRESILAVAQKHGKPIQLPN